MFTSRIEVGQKVQVRTKGGNPPNSAPPLVFQGNLKSEVIGSGSFGGMIEIEYEGEKSVQDYHGKVVGTTAGLNTQTIPLSIVESVQTVEPLLNWKF